MVQLEVLNGNTAGGQWSTRRFPFSVGRGTHADFRIEQAGVWDRHFQVVLERGEGFILQPDANALVSVNAQPVTRAVLRNGDQIEFGAVKLRFWISDAPQRSLRLREALFWAILAGVSLGQIGLIYWLVD